MANRKRALANRQLGRTNFSDSEIVCGGHTNAPGNGHRVEEVIERRSSHLDTSSAYGSGHSELGFARVIAGAKRQHLSVNTNRLVSGVSTARRRLWRSSGASQLRAEEDRNPRPSKIGASPCPGSRPRLPPIRGLRVALEVALPAGVTESLYGPKVDRLAEQRSRCWPGLTTTHVRSQATRWICR